MIKPDLAMLALHLLGQKGTPPCQNFALFVSEDHWSRSVGSKPPLLITAQARREEGRCASTFIKREVPSIPP
jgi:hypothetical protein